MAHATIMNNQNSKILQNKQSHNYRLSAILITTILGVFSGCTAPPQHIKENKTKIESNYKKLKSENPDYHWEFIEKDEQ